MKHNTQNELEFLVRILDLGYVVWQAEHQSHVLIYVSLMEKWTHMSTNLACFGWRAMLQCSVAHVGAQPGQVPSEKCSGWLQRELEKVHEACSLPKLFQKTAIERRKKKKKESTKASHTYFLWHTPFSLKSVSFHYRVYCKLEYFSCKIQTAAKAHYIRGHTQLGNEWATLYNNKIYIKLNIKTKKNKSKHYIYVSSNIKPDLHLCWALIWHASDPAESNRI